MIILYSTHCPQCRALEMKLDKANIEYEVCDDVELMKKMGFQAAPVLDTPEGVFNFSEPVKWVNSKR